MSQPGTPDEQLRDNIGDSGIEEPVEPQTCAPVQPTGHDRIDEALERLDRLHAQDDITAHPGEFDAVHRVLRESLANAGRDEGE